MAFSCVHVPPFIKCSTFLPFFYRCQNFLSFCTCFASLAIVEGGSESKKNCNNRNQFFCKRYLYLLFDSIRFASRSVWLYVWRLTGWIFRCEHAFRLYILCIYAYNQMVFFLLVRVTCQFMRMFCVCPYALPIGWPMNTSVNLKRKSKINFIYKTKIYIPQSYKQFVVDGALDTVWKKK